MNLAGAPHAPEIATMPALSEWLQLMLAEISRKRDDAERAREEQAERSREVGAERARNETGKPL